MKDRQSVVDIVFQGFREEILLNNLEKAMIKYEFKLSKVSLSHNKTVNNCFLENCNYYKNSWNPAS